MSLGSFRVMTMVTAICPKAKTHTHHPLCPYRDDIKNFYNKEKAVAMGKELIMAQNPGLPHDVPLRPIRAFASEIVRLANFSGL
jgi:hypothetical protein